MKNIPPSLLNKLLERLQVSATDANPMIRLISTQATVNTLLTEPIHEDVPAGFGDVTLRQLPGEDTPSLAFAVCIDNGIANVYQRNFPAYMDHPWVCLWTLGAAKDVAIEFDGVWGLEPRYRWYVLKTQELPLIFWVDLTDNLYVQKWQDESTRILLAESVSQISACRGWQSIFELDLDQGLIIGYIKSGSVYYRALCTQDTGEQFWESERAVPEFSSGNTSISVFRTNDYRVGFITEHNGQIKWLLSHRNYVGMAARPESVHVQIQDVSLYITPFIPAAGETGEQVGAAVRDPYLLLYTPEQDLQLCVTSTQRVTQTQVKLILSQPLTTFTAELANSLTLTPERAVTGLDYDGLQQTLLITYDSPVLPSLDITIASEENRSVRFGTYSGQSSPWPVMTVLLQGGPGEAVTNEVLILSTDSLNLSVAVLNTKYGYAPGETLAVQTEGSTLTQIPIGIYPI
jgi:hypothetical protein